MDLKFRMVAKTMKGLEGVLADELRKLGAENVEPGHRMVSFDGDKEMLYRANLCLRTALRILKPFYTFTATDTDTLYEGVKSFDWGSLMKVEDTFSIDMVMNSDRFNHSRFATYRVKDAIADWFRDRCDRRPGVRLTDADFMINVHIQGTTVTLSLDSSGESLHKRGWRVATTEAPINEVLAAGILLMSGYDGSQALVDPMCGSGTFLVEAALIAANINPGVFRRNYAFQRWSDYDEALFESLWDNEEGEREPQNVIAGADMLPAAVEVTRRNLKAAGVNRYVEVEVRKFSEWTSAPANSGILVMNPPYGERISAPDMEELYNLIGQQLKHVFAGWRAWIISLKDEYFAHIGLSPSVKVSLMNGSLDCELREFVMFAGSKREFRAKGGKIKDLHEYKPWINSKNTRKSEKGFKKGSSPRRDEKSDRFKKGFKAENRNNEATEVSENPLAARRNPNALKSIQHKMPSLPKTEGPIMRSRGWKKKSE